MNINLKVEKKKVRLDQYLVENISGFSRTRIQNSIKNSEITINGEKVKPGTILKGGEIILGKISPQSSKHLKKQKMNLDIIYEDDSIAVINKPAGLVVHPGNGNSDGTLVNGMMYHFDKLSIINQNRPGIVHRLDKDTSGVIIIAKTDLAHVKLAKQFEKRKVEKFYKAFVWGRIKNEGFIDGLVGRNRTNRIKYSITPKNGKTSKTLYKREYYFAPFSIVNMKPETGRTHQLRVHCSHIGHPIIGDDLYGGGSTKIKSFHSKYSTVCHRVLKTLGRMALHSHKIKFQHPLTSENMDCIAELPNDMIEARKIIIDNA